MKKILVSECLYGGRAVRYDAREIQLEDRVFLKWKEEGRLIPICPEILGGLSTPRASAQRLGDRILTEDGADVTREYTLGALKTIEIAKENEIAFAIMKQSSPSCGSKIIYDGTFTNKKQPGQGLAVEYLRREGIMVFSEEEIEEAHKYLEENK